MYVRPPNQNKERIKVPENYRGNVFASSGEYTDMPPPTRLPYSSYDLPPERHEDQASEGDRARPDEQYERTLPERFDSSEHEEYRQFLPDAKEHISQEGRDRQAGKEDAPAIASADGKGGAEKSSIFSLLMPPSSNLLHFPFGHGIGSEELLILGIMLLIFLHGSECGEPDNEFLLLLALLLFAG